MAPIRLKNWVPRNTKRTWDWKARNSKEFTYFNVPFAIKEYVQNIVGQILKDLEVREWAGWCREDLREKGHEEQDARKRWLAETYPGLLTGPHGVSVRQKECLPVYILSANIQIPSKTNLMVAIVLWTTGGQGKALSFFNNHLDKAASFESFTVDGESTSKDNRWAVGEKGKGFILATQYLVEKIEGTARITALPPNLQRGISFRVGEQIGELKWKKSRKAGSADSLRVILDDLTTRTVSEYLSSRYLQDIDDAPDGGIPEDYEVSLETAKMREKAGTILKQNTKSRLRYGLDGPDGKSIVNVDEVCITIVGISYSCQPEDLFSAIFGIVPPARQWRIPGRNVEFFFADGDKPRFYLRDQYVPYGIHLNKLSVNYHGELNLSSERISVQNDWKMHHEYRKDIRATLDLAFRTLPDLAIELAVDILTDDHSDAFAGILIPADKGGAAQYRAAFTAAMRQQLDSTPTLPIYPHGPDENLKLFAELALHPVKVTHKVMNILQKSGAYSPIKEYARERLLASPLISDFTGLDHVRAALRTVLPSLPADSVSVRQYDKTYPTVVWDDENKLVAFAQPKPCEEHPTEQCLCWIGPVLQDAAKEYKGPSLSARKLWSAFAREMGGGTTIKRPAPATTTVFETPQGPSFHARSSSSNSTTARESVQAPQLLGSAASTPASIPRLSPTKTAIGNIVVPTQTAQPAGQSNNGSCVVAQSGACDTTSNPTAHPATSPIVPQGHGRPSDDADEAELNRRALAQVSKAILGYDVLKRYDESVVAAEALRGAFTAHKRRIDEKDGEIMALEAENKELREDLTVYEDTIATTKARREFKRQRTA
ncbi:hypothetical protein GGX14DRAFT_543770 [Mycena pura]|uniref:Uncharacterized protein n=1 Tax=Mycena pura TaxID=153505 RepID=A0AAD6V9V3_9AGAR|nr:hypothetical protein GGX14DRAFT_543770 [Mycena pura]